MTAADDTSLEIRPLCLGEEEHWLACATPSEDVEPARTALRASLARGDEEPTCRLLAWRRGECVGRLRLQLPHPGLCLLLSLVVPRAEFLPTAGRALIGAARREHAGREVQALCWEWSVDHDFQRLLEEEGFQVRERKLYVERELDGFQSEGADPFTYLSLAEAGESAFVNILAGLEPAEPGTASQALARTGFQELLDLAGSALDRTGWFLVLRHGEPVGLVLPQLFPDSPAEGTLYWIGLLPGWRGRGWGRVLHARGLELLLGRGARRYIGSTPLDNLPMRRIFQLNGCRERGVRVLLHAQRP